jgi:hypothetical protein
VDDEKGACTIDQEKSIVFLNFPKTTTVSSEQDVESDNVPTPWPSLEAQGLDRIKKKMLRDLAVNTAHKRHMKDAATAASKNFET